ncbi:hypothetical protein PRIPAC_83535, partial [Pristionchus pacificus]
FAERMGDRSDNSMSDAGTVQTDCSSSFHSNDDTQSSFELEDSEAEKIIANIPDTPNTRKSVTFSFSSDNSKPELPSPFLSARVPLSPLVARCESKYDGAYNREPSVIDFTGKDSKETYASENGSSSAGTYHEGKLVIGSGNGELKYSDDQPLISHRESIVHRPSIVSVLESPLNTHYMKVWVCVLLVSITIFGGALIFWPLSTSPPLLPLFQPPRSYELRKSGDPSIHVNRTTQEIRITTQEIHDTFWSTRYTQSFSPIGNESFVLSHSQSRKCSKHVDENVICCKIMESPMCYLRDGDGIRNYSINGAEVMDVETYQGRLHILKIYRQTDEFELFDGIKENKLRADVPDRHSLKHAFLQNGTVYSVYESILECEQVVCIDKECTPIRTPQCNIEKVYAARPSHSLVIMHCDPESVREEGLYKQLECTLSQLLLPSLATIARSAPFQYTRGFNEDQLVYGFADYVHPNIFRLNQLRLREDARWEVVVSNYRLLTLS